MQNKSNHPPPYSPLCLFIPLPIHPSAYTPALLPSPLDGRTGPGTRGCCFRCRRVLGLLTSPETVPETGFDFGVGCYFGVGCEFGVGCDFVFDCKPAFPSIPAWTPPGPPPAWNPLAPSAPNQKSQRRQPPPLTLCTRSQQSLPDGPGFALS